MNAVVLLAALAANLATQAPRLLEPSEPTYPSRALEDRIAATVKLRLEVDEEGLVENVAVVSTTTVAEDPTTVRTSTASYGFEAAAANAARELRFTRAFVDGTAVPFVLEYTYHFELPPLPPPVITRDRPRVVAEAPSADVEPDTYEVLVEAEGAQREVTKRALTTTEIVRVPGTLGDPVLVVENLPGVARTGLDGGMAVRGSSPQDSMTMVEAVPVLIETHFGGFRSVVAPQLVERIDFVPGNFSTRFGRRTGGLLDVQLKKLAPDGFHGEVDLSLLDLGLYMEAPITDELAVAIGGRRSHVDAFLGALGDDGDVQLVAAPRYYDYQALVSWRPNTTHEVELFALGSDDRMTLVFDDIGSTDSRATSSSLSNVTAFQRLSLRHRYRPSPNLRNEMMVAIGRDDVRTKVFGRFDFDAKFERLIARDQLELSVTKGVKMIGGIDLDYYSLDFDITAPRPPKEGQATDPFDQPSLQASGEGLDSTQAGIYVESEIAILDRLTVVPGVRADYFSQVDEVGFDPRLVARWRAVDGLTLRAGVGRVHQEPQLDELVEPYGNPDLSLISATHYAVGATVEPTSFFTADVTFFYKDLASIVSATDRVDVVDGIAFPAIYDNGGSGRAYGLEVMLRHARHADFEGWLSYTLSRAERTDGGENESRLFDYDQTHILAMVGTYHLGETWSVGARWRFVSGRPTTPLLGGIWRAERDAFEPIPGATNSSRLPAFHQLDLRVDKRWMFDAWELAAYLSVSNAYNRANVEALGYNYDYSQTESVSGLPVLPILGVKGAF